MIQQFPEASGCPKCKASFSLVDGHTVIPAHAGPTNARLRAHLGLQVPKKGDVHLRIANQTVGWKPGKWTIIDDSFEHEIINESKSQRLILLVDFMHPDISKNNRENKEEFKTPQYWLEISNAIHFKVRFIPERCMTPSYEP